MYLVVGSTGTIGGKVVRDLHAAGYPVRALVRNPDKATLPDGVQTAVGDLNDPASIAAAVAGVRGVFHMQADPSAEQTQTMIDAAQRAGVEHVVAMTSMGAVLEPLPLMGRFFRAQEDKWRASGLPVTLLRPNSLMSNALWWRPGIQAEGTVADPCGEGRLAIVDSDDVAAVAVTALTEPGHQGHAYLLGGPEALTTREQVAVMAEVLGKPISFQDISPAQHTAAMVAHAGAPAQMTPVIEDLYTMFASGRAGVLTNDVANVTGRAPGTFRAWVERNAALFA